MALNTVDNPHMADRHKELRLRISPGAHHVLIQCAEEQGYSTVAEFVRVAIQQKIAKSCYHLIMTVEEIEAKAQEE